MKNVHDGWICVPHGPLSNARAMSANHKLSPVIDLFLDKRVIELSTPSGKLKCGDG
jgi:hypothetical protein